MLLCCFVLCCAVQTPEFYNFSRLLLKVPEHTWGVDIKKTLHDFQDYGNTHLHDCLPPHLRPTWAHGYSSSGSAGSSSKSVDSVSSKPHSAESSASSGMDSSGGVRASAGNERVRGRDKSFDVDAPCLNYGHCLKAWNRQAAYVDWALQVWQDVYMHIISTWHPVRPTARCSEVPTNSAIEHWNPSVS